MARVVEVRVPDLGGAEGVKVVEVLTAAGDRVEPDQGLITLESEKASMDVPSPHGGTVTEMKVAKGDEVRDGDLIALLEVAEEGGDEGGAGTGGEEPVGEEAGEAVGETAPASAAGRGEAPAGDGEPAERRRRRPAPERDAQVLVLGAGPGGYTAAFRAADLGQQVVLVERHPTLGGVCLNVGCIPSKALLHAAQVIEEAAFFAEHGIAFGEPEIHLEPLREWKDGVVGRLTSGLTRLAEQRRVEVVRGVGRFLSDRELEVEGEGGKRTLSFAHAIIATGSRPLALSGIPGDDPRVMDSTAALELPEIPRRLLLVGGGIIGLEMAMVYGAFGSELTIVELTDGLIPGCDRDLVKPLDRRLRERYGATIHLGSRVGGVEARKRGLAVTFEGEGSPEPATFDRLLVAVGRRPNGDRIGAEAAGVKVTDRGFIPVDRQQRTNVEHIFAIGDVVGPPLLAHKASHEGKVAAEVAAGERSGFDARVIPAVAYTDPEIAWAGLTETAAREQGTAYEKGTFPWTASGRALGIGREDGLTKLLFEPESGRLLGAGVVGPRAGDLISELALAIEMGCVAADIALTIHPHPTLSETIAFAAEAWAGTITDLYLPGRRGGRR